MPSNAPPKFVTYILAGCMLGTAIGTGVGAAIEDVGLRIAMGPGLGMALGLACWLIMRASHARKLERSSSSPNEFD